MKYLFVLFLMTVSNFCFADLTKDDVGEYVVLKKDKTPSDMAFKLSLTHGKWQMFRKQKNGFHEITCTAECQLQSISNKQARAYLPQDMKQNYDINCVQNKANAICRYNLRKNKKQSNYVMIALVTGKPIPIFLKKVK